METGNQCSNSERVDDWQELETEREASPATTRSTDNTVVVARDTAVKIAHLAVGGSVVAVAADGDVSYHYYLLKVTSNGVEELADNTTDDYGSIYNAGQGSA